jgi:hypothetical protein
LAERHFPVRVHVAVPAGGFGHQLTEMYRWLDEHVGKDRYWSGGAGDHSDGACFYFLSVDSAKGFVDRFGCELLVQGDWGNPCAPTMVEYDPARRIIRGGADVRGHRFALAW